MIYKNRNSIPYFKFKSFTKMIEGADEKSVIKLTEKTFGCCVEHFAKALENTDNLKVGYKVDLLFKTAGRFIDCDTYLNDGNELEFFKRVLKKKWFGKKIDDISLAEAETILSNFYQLAIEVKKKYEYLYNPPLRVSTGETTQGSLERQAFAEHYGGYQEMIYCLCQGDFTKFDEVVEWKLNRFLFQAEYLIRKRDVENIK